REKLRRYRGAEPGGLCVLSPAQFSVTPAAQRPPSPEARPAHNRRARGLSSPASDLNTADPLGPDPPPIRPDDQIRHGPTPGDGQCRHHSATLYAESVPAPHLPSHPRTGPRNEDDLPISYLEYGATRSIPK